MSSQHKLVAEKLAIVAEKGPYALPRNDSHQDRSLKR
jgi:hypothetical protein